LADSKITQLTELTTPIATDMLVIVDDPAGTPITKKIQVGNMPGWIYPSDSRWVGTANQPLTSTSWDGDAHSTEAKTLIDLSAVFGVPAGVKAVLVRLTIRDSGSAGGSYFVGLSPNATANEQTMVAWAERTANDAFGGEADAVCPCDANGDIYYQIGASGAGTMDVWIQIWGYCL